MFLFFCAFIFPLIDLTQSMIEEVGDGGIASPWTMTAVAIPLAALVMA